MFKKITFAVLLVGLCFSVFGQNASDFVIVDLHIGKQLEKFKGNDAIVRIPDDIRQVRPGAFSNLPNLKEVYILGKYTSVSAEAFKNCPNLEKVVLNSGMLIKNESFFVNCPKIYSNSAVSNDKLLSTDNRKKAYDDGWAQAQKLRQHGVRPNVLRSTRDLITDLDGSDISDLIYADLDKRGIPRDLQSLLNGWNDYASGRQKYTNLN